MNNADKKIENKIIFNETYNWESLCDLSRDIQECFDSRYNPLVKDLPGEFKGVIKVTLEYIPEGEVDNEN